MMAFTPSAGRIYAFGLGGSGQLGSGSYENKLAPTNVKGPLVPYQKDDCKIPDTPISATATWPPCVVKRIFAGGDQSFAIVSTMMVSLQEKNWPTSVKYLSSNCADIILKFPLANNHTPNHVINFF